MKLAHPEWLLGLLLAAVVAAALIWGGVQLLRSLKRFGDREPVEGLLTHRTGQRRAFKGVLLVLAVVFGFFALAGPQYGRGTRLIPATNLDVVLVLDYSKSMYARDVSPSRIERAKVEIARLIRELGGARFGAVAFAGEPLSFPLTSDGGAIAQFLRQMEPNEMPVGGTAIARALEAARGLFARDPASQRHQKVILLVTDGEDLQGDPVAVAKAAAGDHIVVHVVQIGGRTPEPIPSVNDDGTFGSPRRDDDGHLLTTQLTAEGEKQLGDIAKAANGFVVQAAQGETGLAEVTRAMKQLMTEELSERVETVYADIFHYPLLVCLFLLLIDSLINEAPRTKRKRKDSGASNLQASSVGALLLIALIAGPSLLSGCDKVEEAEQRLFTRYSPAVDEAIADLKKGNGEKAAELLQGYLSTGKCESGQIAAPPTLREKPSASFDLGLALFKLAERFGGRFGDLPSAGEPTPEQQAQLAQRSQGVDCALQIVRVIAADAALAPELRAQAYFLSGNLEFLRGDYEQAVGAYDDCLRLIPGDPRDAGLSVGDDAAFNRAIALRLKQEQEKNQKHPDAGTPPNKGDGGSGQQNDQDKQDQDQQGDQNQQDQQDQQSDRQDQNQGGQGGAPNQQDQSEQQQGGGGQGGQGQANTGDRDQQDSDNQQQNKATQQAKQGQPPPSLSQDERMLDLLEQAPTVQQQQAAKARGRVVNGGMEDK